jgi:hypothetical protein
MTELIRVPSRRHQQQVQRCLDDPAYVPYRVGRFDYMTPDGRWRLEQYNGCGGGWSVIDTTGRYVCKSCGVPDGHTTTVRTLTAALAFISEWAA